MAIAIHKLVMLVLPLLGNRFEARAASIANDAAIVASTEEPFFEGENASERTAMLIAVWNAKESAGIETAIGDEGEAWGAMQIHWRIWDDFLGLDYPAYFDQLQSMRAALRIMRHLKKQCGSPKRALFAYASGSCSGSIRARDLVNARCYRIGGC